MPTRQLISQTIKRAHADFDLSIGAWSASHGRRPRLITAMSYAAFAEMTLDGRLRPEDVDLIVMDEAHRALSELRQDVFGRYLDTTAVMAFTATPAFDEEKALHVLLGAENEVYKADPHELRAEGVLAPFVNLVLDVTLEGDIPSDPDEWRRVRRQAIADAVVDLVATYVPPETGVPLTDRPGLYYCSDIDQTRQLAETYHARLGTEGRRMETVSGADELWRVEAALEELARGDVTGIANCRLLEEGTNVPDVKLVMTMPTLSAVKVVQQGGRCMRVLPELAHSDPRQVAFVIEPVLTINGRREKRVHLYQVWGAETDVQLARARARRITEVTPAPRSEAGVGSAVRPTLTVGGPITITSEIGLVQTFLYGEDLLPWAGEGDLSRKALADRLGVSAGHGVLASAWAAIEEQRAAGA
ncbi:DEAD/DEAH box helicase, partial [Amorphus sp. 3PC139-8]|uniref:DEAD/DEAH box helicase n=1 Tax=Amorphus sp. 3PC139-8 TaxID=2735676 RepID=UPI00345D6DC9